MRSVLIVLILIIGLTACENQEQVFPDYELQAVYFPIQLPIRTLSLGEDRVDNALDREHKFDIGISIGGMYENKKDWTVDYVVDTSLTNNALTGGGAPFVALPESYYTLDPLNTVTIPKGSFNGLIRVQLADQFFTDNLAITGQYVIPLRITDTSADSVLSGKQAKPGPADRRIASDWESGKEPKDWVMYAIKYVNAYHGTYLHRGQDIIYSGGLPVDTVVFRNMYVEKDILIKLTTLSLTKVVTNGIANKTSNTGKYAMELEFGDATGASCAVTITPRTGSNWAVTGTGQYFDLSTSTEKWTGLKWQSMYLSYTFTEGANTHQVVDTLVFRDRGIKFETNTITIAK